MRPGWALDSVSLKLSAPTANRVQGSRDVAVVVVYPRATTSPNATSITVTSNTQPSASASSSSPPSAPPGSPSSSPSTNSSTLSETNTSTSIPSTSSSSSSTSSSSTSTIPSSTTLSPPTSTSPAPPPPPPSASSTVTNLSSLSHKISGLPSSSSTSANFTVTVDVSNPTSVLNPPSEGASGEGFFSHTGAVAGTFLVIGLFSTSIFLCIFFGIRRKLRKRRASRRVYMQDEYRSLSRSLDRQATPEPRASRDSASIRPSNSTTVLPRSRNNSMGYIPFPPMDHSPYRAAPGEFDPYRPEAVTKVYSNDYAEASEYKKYLSASTS